jgi:decaprenylphospho-beta-D-erythro-pentofuranosid-2-ulose 2-reductase
VRDALGDVQSVLVLGATSEIARTITDRLATRRIRRLVLAARRPDDLAEVVARHRADGIAVETVTFDADVTAAHAGVLGAVFDAGDIDLVLVAFAVLGDQAAFDADSELAATAARTNYVGAVSAGLVVADRLRRQGHGCLVLLSSVAAVRPRAANFVYASTKAGLDAFGRGLGDALHGSGVRVMVVRPGFVRTKMTTGRPEAPFTTGPDAVADAVVRGLASGRSVVWSPPALRYVMTAMRHLPAPVWRRLPG